MKVRETEIRYLARGRGTPGHDEEASGSVPWPISSVLAKAELAAARVHAVQAVAGMDPQLALPVLRDAANLRGYPGSQIAEAAEAGLRDVPGAKPVTTTSRCSNHHYRSGNDHHDLGHYHNDHPPDHRDAEQRVGRHSGSERLANHRE